MFQPELCAQFCLDLRISKQRGWQWRGRKSVVVRRLKGGGLCLGGRPDHTSRPSTNPLALTSATILPLHSLTCPHTWSLLTPLSVSTKMIGSGLSGEDTMRGTSLRRLFAILTSTSAATTTITTATTSLPLPPPLLVHPLPPPQPQPLPPSSPSSPPSLYLRLAPNKELLLSAVILLIEPWIIAAWFSLCLC